MLSILIPTYDYTCYKLVYDLHQQAESLGIAYEIIVVEDGSHYPVSIIANHKIIELSNCRHIQHKENMGRAAIRNFLIDESKGDMLLFMDADGKVVSEEFLKKYVEAGKEHDVVCGGICHPDVCYNPHKQLRWKYEKRYEEKHGYISQQFRSFCFMVSREVAQKVRFDERFKMYGYEDVLFGKELEKAGYKIHGIENPLMNSDIEDNDVFLKKTEEALKTAHRFQKEIGDDVTIVHIYNKYRGMGWAMRVFFAMFKGVMKHNLLSSKPSLSLFSLYKLCYYSTL